MSITTPRFESLVAPATALLHDGTMVPSAGETIRLRGANSVVLECNQGSRFSATPEVSNNGTDWYPATCGFSDSTKEVVRVATPGNYVVNVSGWEFLRCPIVYTRDTDQPITIRATTSNRAALITRPPQKWRFMPGEKSDSISPDWDFTGNHVAQIMSRDDTHRYVATTSRSLTKTSDDNFESGGPSTVQNFDNLPEFSSAVIEQAWVAPSGAITAIIREQLSGENTDLRVMRSNDAQDSWTEVFDVPQTDSRARVPLMGFDRFENIYMFNEYYPDSAQNTRKAWISEDHGATWREMFEAPVRAGVHLHGVSYDPYEDLCWAIVGDGAGNAGVYCSPDRGETWFFVRHSGSVQFTSVGALPDSIFLATDERLAYTGMFRIDRPRGGIRSRLSLASTNSDGFYVTNPVDFGVSQLFAPYSTDNAVPISIASLVDHRRGIGYMGFLVPGPEKTRVGSVFGSDNGVDWSAAWTPPHQPPGPTNQGVLRFADQVTEDGTVYFTYLGQGPGGEGGQRVVKIKPFSRENLA